jgi:hypothetical protein
MWSSATSCFSTVKSKSGKPPRKKVFFSFIAGIRPSAPCGHWGSMSRKSGSKMASATDRSPLLQKGPQN